MTIPHINSGEPIRAPWLNRIVGASNRGMGFDAANDGFAGGLPRPGADNRPLWCVVAARNVTDSTPAALHNITYTLRIQDIAVLMAAPWTRRIVDVQPDLLGPDAADPMLFHPAPIAGSAETGDQWWRAYGLVYRSPIVATDGSRDWAVRLFGEHPHRGCPPPPEDPS